MYPTKLSLHANGFTSIAIDLPEEKPKNEHMLQGFFLEKHILCHFGVKKIKFNRNFKLGDVLAYMKGKKWKKDGRPI